ncbi:cell division protein FtsA [Clostridium formicaceticum]|uniref:Cell division protein FtsA n=1 Tax=Clostridium formicaceticum TaxID=1497 RepID=A0AAC9WFH8_9CLOT|nr:cell division FtsA domain-containing protein [Clostridium formicaceticum]AOY76338.1 hypothetical protein BJL90_10740 [Clostridium formicaceticum]ARE86729.1 Cell division protein FtsA [Clostridium formicaceticum]
MVFVLDIGTRSIVGLLGTLQEEKIIIHHGVIEFHKKRVMYDGQIHDIEGVTEVVQRVKEKLEEEAGFSLKEVSVAAAGRALKTFQTTVEKELDEYKEIDRHFINSIEIEGIQKAQKGLEEQTKELVNYFCVGHTTINYYLNDGIITNPVGHRGKKLKVDLLATFLPRIVVDSLHTVMNRVGLEVAYLTLEPIAAIEVAVPQNLRLLNIALVDIGAGTSDIAITKDGTVTAYGMTSTAGDEITEEIVKTFLLDFDTAENLKCNLCKEEIQRFTDIVGISYEVSTEEILGRIQPAIKLVAKEIADNILLQNGKSPSVIFLIGGGSQLPGLSKLIAEYLEMPQERVVVRGIDMIQNLQWDTVSITGPEGITPIGILAKAIKSKSTDFIEVKINSKKIRLFKTDNLKVSDALAVVNFNPRGLIPQKGGNMKILVNNQEKIIFGEYGEPAKILVNNRQAHLDTNIEDRDEIVIHPATEGRKASSQLKELINLQENFLVNSETVYRYQEVKVNGKPSSPEYYLEEGDQLVYHVIKNIRDLCNFMAIDFAEHDIYIEGKKVEEYSEIDNEKQVIIDRKKNNQEKKDMEIIYNGEPLRIPATQKDLIFVDIFNYIDFDRSVVQGKLILKHNGKDANYTDPLQEGDNISIYWENLQ